MIVIKDPQECATMAEVRTGVDAIDDQIIGLIARRFGYMDAAARIKQDRGAVRDEARKAQVLDNVRRKAERVGLDPAPVVALYDALIEASIAHELRKFDERT